MSTPPPKKSGTHITTDTGMEFHHFGNKQGSGFRIAHPGGRTQYMYLVPVESGNEGGVQKVRLVEGGTGVTDEDQVVGEFQIKGQ